MTNIRKQRTTLPTVSQYELFMYSKIASVRVGGGVCVCKCACLDDHARACVCVNTCMCVYKVCMHMCERETKRDPIYSMYVYRQCVYYNNVSVHVFLHIFSFHSHIPILQSLNN